MTYHRNDTPFHLHLSLRRLHSSSRLQLPEIFSLLPGVLHFSWVLTPRLAPLLKPRISQDVEIDDTEQQLALDSRHLYLRSSVLFLSPLPEVYGLTTCIPSPRQPAFFDLC